MRIGRISRKGSAHEYEDVIQHAWQATPKPYFIVPAGQVNARYETLREPYRGLAPTKIPPKIRPDAIVFRIQHIQGLPSLPLRGIERDILWIGCNAPCRDKPYELNIGMGEVVDQLAN